MKTRLPSCAAALAAGLATILSPTATAQHFDQTQGPAGVTSGTAFDETSVAAQHITQVEVAHTAFLQGIRFTTADAARTTTTTSPWMGSSSGTVATFEIPPGDLLEAVDFHHDPALSIGWSLTLRTNGGHSATLGTPQGLTSTLSLADHEIVGFHGVTGRSSLGFVSIAGLGVHLRPAWESTHMVHEIGGVGPGTSQVAPLGTHIARLRIAWENSRITGVRFTTRDEYGIESDWGPWVGVPVQTHATHAIPQGDHLVTCSAREHSSQPFITRVRFFPQQGRSFGVGGSSTGPAQSFTTDTSHEIVGFFAFVDTTSPTPEMKSFGAIQRPIVRRTWEAGAGCAGSSGQVPNLQLTPTTVLGSLDVELLSPASPVGILAVSGQTTSIPLGACTLFVDPLIHVPIPASGPLSFPLLGNWDFVGVPLYFQAVLLDAGKLVVSDAAGTIIGGI